MRVTVSVLLANAMAYPPLIQPNYQTHQLTPLPQTHQLFTHSFGQLQSERELELCPGEQGQPHHPQQGKHGQPQMFIDAVCAVVY